MAAKTATTVDDVTGLEQRYQPYNVPHLVKKIKGFPLKVKSFQNTATCQKLRGGIPSTPLPLYHGGGMNLLVHPRVKLNQRSYVSPQLLKNGRLLTIEFRSAKLHFDRYNTYLYQKFQNYLCQEFFSLLCSATVHSNLQLKGSTNRL